MQAEEHRIHSGIQRGRAGADGGQERENKDWYSRSQTRLAKNCEGIPHSEPGGRVQWSAVPPQALHNSSLPKAAAETRSGAGWDACKDKFQRWLPKHSQAS